MYTLIEIFDSKQYENIIAPVTFRNISKLIYVGSSEIMTKDKVQNLKSFFIARNFTAPIEFFSVKRDDTASITNVLEKIIHNNKRCVFDVTGGEDVILVNVGIFSQKHSVPAMRIDTKSGKFSLINGTIHKPQLMQPKLTTSDFITLQGAKILNSTQFDTLTKQESNDIRSLFNINSNDCEAYSIFCNFAAEYLSSNGKLLRFNPKVFEKLRPAYVKAIKKMLMLLCNNYLLKENKRYAEYTIKNNFIAVSLKRAGNALENYTALAALELQNEYSDIRVGTSIEWNGTNKFHDTQNEIDVLAVSNNMPVFISCKNGDAKKEALYELDTVSRVLGGVYVKKILVCTYISKNASAREHFIARAHDMGIKLIYNTHQMSYEEFINRMAKAVK